MSISWSSVSGNSNAKLIESEFPSHYSMFLPKNSSFFAMKVTFFAASLLLYVAVHSYEPLQSRRLVVGNYAILKALGPLNLVVPSTRRLTIM